MLHKRRMRKLVFVQSWVGGAGGGEGAAAAFLRRPASEIQPSRTTCHCNSTSLEASGDMQVSEECEAG